MIKAIRIWWLKKQFKYLATCYMEEFDRFDCGVKLAEEFSPLLRMLKIEMRRRYNALRKIDKNCPKLKHLEV